MIPSMPAVTAPASVTNFTPEQARRWDAWQRANAESAHRSDRICQTVAAVLFLALLIATVVAAARR